LSFNPDLCRNESEVESKLIVQYLLPKLGYSPDTWYQEVTFGRIRLDFLVFATQVIPFVLDASSPLSIVMEAKHPKENLNNHIRRLRRYLVSLNVQYGLLTNGREIRIYHRKKDDIKLLFQCSGEEIDIRLDEIQALIGKNSLTKIVDKSPITIKLKTVASRILQASPNKNLAIERQQTMKTIAIYHHKGGVGKTTVAINLAAALRKKGKRILLIDIDAQANTTFATGLIKFQFEEEDDLKDRNVYHLLESTKHEYNFIPGVVRKSNFFNQPEIDIVPSHITLIERQDKLVGSGASRLRLARKLGQVRNEYDIVIIDTPPSLDLYAQAALTAADYLIIPSDLKPFSNQGLSSVKNFIEQEINENKEGLNKEGLGQPTLTIMGVLPSKISPSHQFIKYVLEKHKSIIPERYGLPLMDSMIFERVALSHCINKTISVGNLDIPDPKSILDYADETSAANTAAAEFESLALEVLSRMEMQ
jgi:chromosome partitioning protein